MHNDVKMQGFLLAQIIDICERTWNKWLITVSAPRISNWLWTALKDVSTRNGCCHSDNNNKLIINVQPSGIYYCTLHYAINSEWIKKKTSIKLQVIDSFNDFICFLPHNLKMWKAAAGAQISIDKQSNDDDWETDPDFINDVTEQEQRWGSTTIEGSGRTVGAIE